MTSVSLQDDWKTVQDNCYELLSPFHFCITPFSSVKERHGTFEFTVNESKTYKIITSQINNENK